jgi:hypothetical protein
MATPTTLPATFVSGNVLTAAQMNDLRGAFRILQVVSTNKTDSFSTSSTSFVDVTGLSVSITPSSTSSKIYVVAALSVGSGTNTLFMNLVRDSTAIAQPSAGTSPATSILGSNDTEMVTMTYLDSPNTTSATTYKVQFRVNTSTGYVNRSNFDINFTSPSNITVMEISA